MSRAREPPSSSPETPLRLVSFDIDGTISVGHGWQRIAASRGLQRQFREAQSKFTHHQRGENAHLRALLDLARGMPLRDLEEVLASTPHLGRLAACVEALHRRGAQVALLTHNPLYVCAWYARHFGFDLWAGVEHRVVRGRIQAAGPMHVDKREGFRLLLEASGVRPQACAHVGDGWADAKVFPFVGTGIALNSRLADVREAADWAVETSDARRLLPHLWTAARNDPRPLPRRDDGEDHRGSFRLGVSR